MAGRGPPPPSFRKTIRELGVLLSDQYKWDETGFAILKEFVQNADDASARVLHLGWSRGFPGKAAHPLLQSPALFVVNDGRFDHGDVQNLARLGENSKANDIAKIGKFGLGLKSVFHLCEAFFHLASELPEAAGSRPGRTIRERNAVYNPWSPSLGSDEEGPHEDWDRFDEADRLAIREILTPVLQPLADWFCLWIPLRTQDQLNGHRPITKHFFQGVQLDEFVAGLSRRDTAVRLAELLPLLRHLRAVHCWTPLGADSVAEEFSVRLTESTVQRLSLPDGIEHPDREWPVEGAAELLASDPTPVVRCPFVGCESRAYSDTGLRKLLHNQDFWPDDSSLDPETDQGRDHREKAAPVGAVRFMEIPTRDEGAAGLTIQWAVFLPLGDNDGEIEAIACRQLNARVSLFLDGYFFIDAGRNRVKHPTSSRETLHEPANESELRAAWNDRLARVATLPLIIPSLQRFVEQSHWSEDRVSALTRAIGESNLFGVHRFDICRQWQWVFVYQSDSRDLGRWQKVVGSDHVLQAPAPDTSELLRTVFPDLGDAIGQQKLTFDGYPRLACRSDTADWAPELLMRLLNSVRVETVFRDASALAYLVRFLRQTVVPSQIDEVRRALMTLVRRAFLTVPLELIERNAAQTADLVRIALPMPHARMTWARSRTPAAGTVFKEFSVLTTDVVLIPGACMPPNSPQHPTKPLRTVDAVKLLRCLVRFREDGQSIQPKLYREVVESVMDQTDARRDEVFAACRDLPLFGIDKILPPGPQQVSYASWAELQERRERGTLFLGSTSELAQNLAKALRDAPVWLLSKEFAQTVIGEGAYAPDCDQKGCVELLIRKSFPLASAAQRLPLLKTLALDRRYEGQTEWAKAMRCLVHGSSEHRDSADALLLIDGRDVWSRLAAWCANVQNAQWRILEPEVREWAIGDPTTSLRLGIKSVDRDVAVDFLRGLGPDQLCCLGDFELSDDDYRRILAEIDDVELLRRLPIYPALDGRHVAIAGRAFWWSGDYGGHAHESLLAGVTLLKPVGGPQAKQRRLRLAEELRARQMIQMAMDCQQPSQYWQTVLDALARVDQADEPLLDLLRRTAWLPTEHGDRAPDHVICLPDLTAEITELAANTGNDYIHESAIQEDFRRDSGFQRIRQLRLLPDEAASWRRTAELARQHGDTCRDWQLFPVHRVRSGGESQRLNASWGQLQKWRQHGMLFLGSPVNEVAAHYARAAAEQAVQLIDKELARDILGEPHDVPECTAAGCVTALVRNAVQLATFADRCPLLERLAFDRRLEGTPEYRTAIRYLLHGNREHRNESVGVFRADDASNAADIWSRLMTAALNKQGSNWRVLEPEAGAWAGKKLSKDQQDLLGIRLVSSEGAIAILKSISSEQRVDLPLSDLSESDYRLILTTIADDDLLRSLPIHRTIDGQAVPIATGQTFWWSGDKPLDYDLRKG